MGWYTEKNIMKSAVKGQKSYVTKHQNPEVAGLEVCKRASAGPHSASKLGSLAFNPANAASHLNNWVTSANSFCYMCGKWKFHKQFKKITSRIENVYKYCFNINIEKHIWILDLISYACVELRIGSKIVPHVLVSSRFQWYGEIQLPKRIAIFIRLLSIWKVTFTMLL